MRSKTYIITVIAAILLLAAQFTFAGTPGTYTITSTSGVEIDPGTNDIGFYADDATTLLSLPFSYNFYGQNYDEVIVSANGNIQFAGNTNSNNPGALPLFEFGPTIFAYEGDLYEGDSESGQGIFTSVTGEAPNRVFNIEWRARFCCSGGGYSDNFEIRLYEGQPKFDVVYGGLSGSGENVVVGVQKDNTDFTMYESNSEGALAPNTMLTFTGFAPTAAEASISGRVLDPYGKGVSGATVQLNGSMGIVDIATTASDGSFRFKDIQVGEFYILTIRSKRYKFSNRFVDLQDDVSGMVITPMPGFVKPVRGPGSQVPQIATAKTDAVTESRQ
jgi:carboxypeptidase family protein